MDIHTFTNLNPRVLQVGPGGCPWGVWAGWPTQGVLGHRSKGTPEWAPGQSSGLVLPHLTPAHSLGKHCPAGSPLGPKAGPLHDSRSLLPWPPLPLKNLSVDNVRTLLGQNVGDLQKARSHPAISSWLRSLNKSALGELGLDRDPASPTSPTRTHNTPWTSHLTSTWEGPGKDAPSSGAAPHPALPPGRPSPASTWPCLPRASMDPKWLLVPNLILCWPTVFPFASRLTFG